MEQKFALDSRVRWAHPDANENETGTVTGFDAVTGVYEVSWDDGSPWGFGIQPQHLTPANDFAAGWNVPGYSPDPEHVTYFDTASEAWAHLRDELDRWLDNAEEPTDGLDSETFETSLAEMESFRDDGDTGTVYSNTPGYFGDHDLGYAWWVQPS